jgi:hypothetical protein
VQANKVENVSMLEWGEGESDADLLEKLVVLNHHQFEIDTNFFNNLFGFQADSFKERLNKIINALKASNVNEIWLKELPELSHRKSRRRFRTFCKSLGGLVNTTILVVSPHGDSILQPCHVAIIRGMPHIKDLKVYASHEIEGTFRNLAAALQNHACLTTALINSLPPMKFSIIMPVLFSIQSLEELELDGPGEDEEEEHLQLENAHSVAAAVLRCTIPEKLILSLSYWTFATQESQDIICAAFREKIFLKIVLEYCIFADPVSLALSLTHSELALKELTIHRLSFVNDREADFADALASKIHGMSQLEKFDCGDMWHYTNKMKNHPELDFALVRVTQALAQCRSLKMLRLSCRVPFTELDQALAECVTSENNQLAEIRIKCEPIDASAGTTQFKSPAFLEAVKSNYTIQCIALTYYVTTAGFKIDPWEPTVKKSLEVIPKLNAAGRKYLAANSTDQIAGYQVLEQVSDDLDCLFYHTCENPLLCVRQTWKAGTKRKVGQ